MEIVNDLVVHGVSLQAVEAAIYCLCCLITVVGYVAEFAVTRERMYEVHPAGSIMIVSRHKSSSHPPVFTPTKQADNWPCLFTCRIYRAHILSN